MDFFEKVSKVAGAFAAVIGVPAAVVTFLFLLNPNWVP
jgi:hypothetical protein